MSSRNTPNWLVGFLPRGERDFDALPERVRREVVDLLEALADDPDAVLPEGLRGMKDTFKLRVGDSAYRIIFVINRRRRQVWVVRVANRDTVYSGLPG